MNSNNQETFSQQAVIKVVGVGGGGGNAVNRMIENDVQGVEFVIINTDAQVLRLAKANTRLQIGKLLTKGLGAGADPEIGRQAAEESEDDIREILRGSDMVFITAGMGGGTGTGASPVVARVAKELGCLTVAIVTKPFTFEGGKRQRQALKGLEDLKPYVDTLIIVPNDKLLTMTEKTLTMLDAFKEVDNVLRRAVQGIAEVVTLPGIINLDFADVKNVMRNKGTALMGVGVASGPNRAIEAARKSIRSPLLEIDINGATDAIVLITCDNNITMDEILEVTNEIKSASTQDMDIVFGVGLNMDLEGELIVTIIATGFDQKINGEEELEQVPSNEPELNANQEPVLNSSNNEENNQVGRRKREPGEAIPDWLRTRFK